MEVQKTTVNTNEGEITKAARAIDPIWKLLIALAGFIGVVYAGSEAWIKIKATETKLNALEERFTRQYTTHKNEIDAVKKDTDDEMDVLEGEIDKLKEQANYKQGYEQALKDLKK